MRIDVRGTMQQKCAGLLAGPVTITCASVPSLNGNYPIDAATQALTTSVAAAINAGLGLPSGQDTFNWPDAAGNRHDWPAPQFTQFAKGMMQFIYQCTQAAQGHSDTLPSPMIAID
jgi:hypothetical protein